METRSATLVIERRGTASLRSRAVAAGVRAVVRPRLARLAAEPLGPRALRRAAALDRLAAITRPPRGTRHEPVRLDGFGAEWVHGPGVPAARDRAAILYLHGGGWICCGLNTHRRMVSRYSAVSGVPALSVDYRMIPQVPFEEEVEDCLTAYRWLLDRGLPADRIVIMGDSAGGYLTFATALRAREAGLPPPAGLVGVSPMLDMDLTGKLAHANAALDPAGPTAVLEWLVESLLGEADLTDPRISPIRADLAGLPPVLLTAGSTEILYCDSETMASRLAAAGVPCTLAVWDRQIHVFQMFGPLLPESRAAYARIGAFVRDAVGPPPVAEGDRVATSR